MTSANKIKKVWIAAFPKSDGRPSNMLNICMRFDYEAWQNCVVAEPVNLSKQILPTISKAPEDKDKKDIHLILGLIEKESLYDLNEAIVQYLQENPQL